MSSGSWEVLGMRSSEVYSHSSLLSRFVFEEVGSNYIVSRQDTSGYDKGGVLQRLIFFLRTLWTHIDRFWFFKIPKGEVWTYPENWSAWEILSHFWTHFNKYCAKIILSLSEVVYWFIYYRLYRKGLTLIAKTSRCRMMLLFFITGHLQS